ncbi:Pex24p-domain-containing protein [Hortaea werneckii]|nr:Pex24p-domain-containing protein [Hortaea werneckii]KAI6863379.1 Pex24p-domain-containing protein [Hortaea werneckii]KAI7553419.1 Pex24p-domain-containing protein [Hortaea werneckii]KAI7616708.1 Pex24p-domain-containing protein [Hortaea werneckii]
MAAFDSPWITSMSNEYSPSQHRGSSIASAAQYQADAPVSAASPQPTVAAFAPNQTSARGTHGHRSSVIIHQKSPLLIATPPQVTRALAYSHPFILPLNHFAGLISWTTGDPWESFLLVCAFWFTVLYGDHVLRWGGPLLVVAVIILGMYTRRYSPLSSTTWAGEKSGSGKRARSDSEGRKSLDEILETLQTFTARCEVLLDPFLRMTEFLSTQSSATKATTRPALTTLFIRILACTPLWILLTLPSFYILTTKRLVLALGTLLLSFHSRPARVTRTLLWRSRTIRSLASLLTGLDFPNPTPANTSGKAPPLPRRPNSDVTSTSVGTSASKPTSTSPGIRFTFTLYEHQRRWLGLGWTSSLLSYERQNFTDEHLNPAPSPSDFTLPDTTEDMPQASATATRWRWVPGSEWKVEGATSKGREKEKSAKRLGGGGGGDESGWVYFDNKWLDGRKTDGWGRYTRRRKWMRDAELVEISPDEEQDEGTLQSVEGAWDKLRREGKKETEGPPHSRAGSIDRSALASAAEDSTTSHHLLTPSRSNFTSATSPASTSHPATTTKSRKKSTASSWLESSHRPSSDSSGVSNNNNNPTRHRALSKTSLTSVDAATSASSITAGDTSSSTRGERRATGGGERERDSPEDDRHVPLHYRQTDWDRSINEGVAEGLS